MEKETLAVRWVEHKDESPPERRHNRSYPDPTADVEYAECYAELANAIVLQAFKDYRKALFKLVQEPEEWKHRSSKKKLE